MAKSTTLYVCQSCGASFSKWGGKCDACGEWNTLIEEAATGNVPKGLSGKRGKGIDFVGLDGEVPPAIRRATGIAEFDRVTGGGLVRGSALLVGGDPGIGKSTLLLQVAAAIGTPRAGLAAGHTAYVSG